MSLPKFSHNRRLQVVLTAGILNASVVGGANAALMYDAGALDFETTGQSMWGSGAGFNREDSMFLGAEWDGSTTFGGIAGGVHTTSVNTNPLWHAWRLCKDTINIWCGSEPDRWEATARVDTRTGAELTVDSAGRAGLEFGYTIDSGTVDASVAYSASAELPDTPVEQFEFFDINPDSVFDDGSISTQSPHVEAYINAVLELSGSVEARACLAFAGCTPTETLDLGTIDWEQSILSVDPNSLDVLDGVLPGDEPLLTMPLVEQLSLELSGAVPPTGTGFELTGPGGVELASTVTPGALTTSLTTLDVRVPSVATTGGKSGGVITSEGSDEIASFMLDIDGMGTASGLLPPLGVSSDLVNTSNLNVSAEFDLIDLDIGTTLGLSQNFELTPTLMVSLAFSNPIQIAGMAGLQSSWMGRWSDLPSFALLETTTFSPTFWVDAMLQNELGLDLGLVGTLDLLRLAATAEVAGLEILNTGSLSLNNLLGLGNELFSTDPYTLASISDSFLLGGFNYVQGRSFTVTVPAPGTLWVLLAGLITLMTINRHNRSAALVRPA